MLRRFRNMSMKRRVVLVLLAMLLLYPAMGVYRLVRWQAYIWFPAYVESVFSEVESVSDDQKHLIFIMVDHYEPGYGKRGAETNAAWLKRFRTIADKHSDDYGNTFRYSWFYPYDHRNDAVLVALCKAVYDGYGEVELHWHHPCATSQSFPGMLTEAIAWFQQYGALISSGPQPETHFAFIHGNWALDNSTPQCGVNNELEILFKQGCYADFTFSTIGTNAQPSKINSIYYARDSDDPKSYDDGQDAEVGNSVNDRLMIFEGPLGWTWNFRLEYGAVESYAIPTPARIHRWIDANIHVRGRPEWVFVKVYSHGSQSADVILNRHLSPMLTNLKRICQERGIKLHFMTAREAYNVVKAAEEGRTENPELYRDYRIPKPCNTYFYTDVPVHIERITTSEKIFRPLSH